MSPFSIGRPAYHQRSEYLAGFTLAELLISLGILGIIATFTISKILTSSQEGKYDAMAKEAAATIAQAYQEHKRLGLVSANTSPADLFQYINYVRMDTSTQIDSHQGVADAQCDGTSPCVLMHNGGILMAKRTTCDDFGGTSSLHVVEFLFDPDARYSGSTTGNYKAVQFMLYYNGFLTTRGNIKNNTDCGAGAWGPFPSYDPPWFSWSG
jgi:prepilin-type N-terminal cleavage/methylation domain-containing protein